MLSDIQRIIKVLIQMVRSLTNWVLKVHWVSKWTIMNIQKFNAMILLILIMNMNCEDWRSCMLLFKNFSKSRLYTLRSFTKLVRCGSYMSIALFLLKLWLTIYPITMDAKNIRKKSQNIHADMRWKLIKICKNSLISWNMQWKIFEKWSEFQIYIYVS